MKIIALVAESGAGKGLFIQIVKKYYPNKRIEVVRFSDVLRDMLDILGKEKSRNNIDMLVTALREAFDDEGILSHAIEKRLKKCDADIVILDGLRKIKEILLVHACGGILIFIAADQKIRYKRRKQSAEKPDEIDMSWEQFVLQGNAAPEKEICTIGQTLADMTIENNGSIEEFEVSVKGVIDRCYLADT